MHLITGCQSTNHKRPKGEECVAGRNCELPAKLLEAIGRLLVQCQTGFGPHICGTIERAPGMHAEDLRLRSLGEQFRPPIDSSFRFFERPRRLLDIQGKCAFQGAEPRAKQSKESVLIEKDLRVGHQKVAVARREFNGYKANQRWPCEVKWLCCILLEQRRPSSGNFIICHLCPVHQLPGCLNAFMLAVEKLSGRNFEKTRTEHTVLCDDLLPSLPDTRSRASLTQTYGKLNVLKSR